MLGIILALLSAVASAFSVVWVRKYSDRSSALNVSIIITIVGLVFLWPLALTVTDFGYYDPLALVLFAIGGILSPGLVRLLYYEGLKRVGVQVNSSVYAAYPLYSALLAVLFLGEILSAWNVFGIFAIIGGVILIEMGPRSHGLNAEHKWRSLVFPILGGVVLGISAIVRKAALDIWHAPVLGVAVAYVFSMVPYFMILLYSKPIRQSLALKQSFRWFWIPGIGQAVSWMLAFVAFIFEKVSIVTPLLAVEPLFVVFFAYFAIRGIERITPQLVISMVLTVIGIILVSVS
jgi:drug/metabolite transporter, DME family